MKLKASFVAFSSALFLFACVKSSTKPADEQVATGNSNSSPVANKYSINFSLGNVNVDNDNRIGTREVPAGYYLRYIFYGAYDTTGRLVSKKIQSILYPQPYFPEFGQISDSLPSGKFTIIIAGGDNRIFDEENYADSTIDAVKLWGRFGPDVFCKKFDINVANNDSSYGNLKLERIAASLQVNVTDSFPKNVAGVYIRVYDQPMFYAVNTGALSGVDSTQFYFMIDEDHNIATSGEYHFIGSPNKHTISINAYSEFGRTIYQKNVENVYLKPNKKMILSGTLFDSPVGGNPMIVTVDQDYSDSTVVKF